MSSPVVVSRIQNRRGTQTQFNALYPPGYTGTGGYGSIPGFNSTNFPDVLLPGELAFCTDTRRTFLGNINGEYVELAKSSGSLTLLPLVIQLPPVGVFTVIPQLTFLNTPFFSILYDLSDNLSPDWNAVGTLFTRNATLQIATLGPAATVPRVTSTDIGTEINKTANNIYFNAIHDITLSQVTVSYKHNFAGNLTFSSSSINWLPF